MEYLVEVDVFCHVTKYPYLFTPSKDFPPFIR